MIHSLNQKNLRILPLTHKVAKNRINMIFGDFMSDWINVAQEFAEVINSEYILKIILFGSVARGDDNDDSDIDILIISNYGDNMAGYF